MIAGLASASGAAEVTDAYRVALLITAGLAAAAGPIMAVGLAARVRAPRVVRRLHCAVDGPPIQPDPARCPVSI